ncbi:MAG TPA: TIGR01777 family oxidoreductase [Roseiflexaceae bacterium]|nr:TIGR01777 family oxidoreductase [Roseiflexaceae bacterium]
MSDRPRIVLAGGSGFLGQALATHFATQGYEMVSLTRSPATQPGPARAVAWDGFSLGPWRRELDGAAALINLAGKSVNCRYTPANRREIVASRVNSVELLAQALRGCRTPPPIWVQAGSLAIYGDAGDRLCDENAPLGTGFSVETCLAWERAFDAAELPATRRVMLRTGFVLGRDGGALEMLARLARLFLGGAAGSGRQYISWLHLEDFNRVVGWCLDRPDARGVYNTTGPEPATNAAFMRALRRTLRRPWSPPIPAPAVRLGARLMGTEGSLALTGRRCLPRRLLDQGFVFRFPVLEPALADLFR